MAAEKPSSKGQAWFCTTGLPSDIVIEVDDMSFHLHKFPLMSKSLKLHQLITEQETKPSSAPKRQQQQQEEQEPQHEIEEETEEQDQEDQEECRISFPDFPGGSETFELAAKFCYGVKMDLSSSTVAPLRCAGEYLEMTEEYSEDNLISKTERFLSQSVLKSIKESIKALKSCERVMPLAESLGITQRCLDSISSRAASADPSLFGWPVTVSEGGRGSNETANQVLWNGIQSNLRRKGAINAADSWFEDLAQLSLPLFKRLIFAMRDGDLSPEIIESCLMYYAKKYIPGISRSNRKQPPPPPSTSTSASTSLAASSDSEQREILETIISNLPLEKNSRSSSSPLSTATRFLFGLLRSAIILNASEACRAILEKKIGLQLEQATLDDLLIPSYSYLNETLYDVDCVERILGYFLDGLNANAGAIVEAHHHHQVVDGTTSVRSPTLMLVGKLIDGYLSEIASDANLKSDKFYNLAISLPDQARLFDDGLYRAVDVYLKAHPWLPEAEREKICGVMDCQKLTLEACTHAAQNERLPLRAVVQVLFFEQLQLRHAIAGTLLAAEMTTTVAPPSQEPGRPSGHEAMTADEEEEEEEQEEEIAGAAQQQMMESGNNNNIATWRAAVRENQVLRLDMDSMRTRVHQLERECCTMKKVIEKIDKGAPRNSNNNNNSSNNQQNRGWRGSLSKKFGCKFKTQVCDSHEQTVVEARKGRQQHHQR